MSNEYVVLIQPEPTREYDEPEVIGPFVDDAFAADYIANHIEVGTGYTAQVVAVQRPDEDEGEP